MTREKGKEKKKRRELGKERKKIAGRT
jgi:hypothetical protein